MKTNFSGRLSSFLIVDIFFQLLDLSSSPIPNRYRAINKQPQQQERNEKKRS